MILNQTASQAKVFNLVLGNSLLSFLVTVPCFVYKAGAMEKKYYFAIPASVLVSAFVCNVLILTNHAALAFSVTSVFLIILFIPVFMKKTNAGAENNDDENLGKTGLIMFCIALIFTFTAFLLNKFAVKIPYLISCYFAVFTIVYQIPGFLYCKIRLRRRSKSINLSQLTKREKEVVTEICDGLKYEEIADKLFVSLSAVKKHTYNIYRKLGIKNNRELMLLVHNTREP
jgi:DNA-binding CsgD family transcriptional regulator